MENSIVVETLKNREKEYIVKDYKGITIGRVFIIEISKENKYCLARLKFYKEGEEGYQLLKELLSSLLKSFFINMKLTKVEILCDEDIMTKPFVDGGFELEGIITNSIISDNSYRDELMFGINLSQFQNRQRVNILRLKGENIDLKVLNPEDSEEMFNFYKRNKDYLKPFEPSRNENFYTIYVQKQLLIESYKQYLNGVSVNFGIYKNGILIGKVQLSNIVEGVFKSGIVGYSVDKNEQGKGYMKEALNLVVEYAFQEMELHRIEASTLVDNHRSQGVLKGCDFTELGINKKYLFIDGEWRDHITFYKINN